METTGQRKILQQLARNVRAARKALGISQLKLAERADLSAGYLNDLEGGRRWVGADTMARLADALHLKPFELLLEDERGTNDLHVVLAQIVSDLRLTFNADIEKIVMKHASSGGTTRRGHGPATKK